MALPPQFMKKGKGKAAPKGARPNPFAKAGPPAMGAGAPVPPFKKGGMGYKKGGKKTLKGKKK